jgi:Trk K+ transport system NAD-binding subunit
MPIPRIDQLEVPRQERTSRRGSRLWREWCFLRVVFQHFRIRFLIMAAILLGGAIMFMVFEPEKKHSFVKAVFFTWSLIFAQPPEGFPDSHVLRVLFFAVPVLGLTVIIEAIVDFSLTLRDRKRFERSWCTMLASSYSNHIVLVGFGKLGYRVFNVLRKLGEAVVVIERDATNQFLEEIRRDGSPLLIGDARREALLAEGNIKKARSIILATNDDLANVEIALDAQQLNSKIRIVLRMFDQNMADKISNGFNIQMAASAAALSAPTFATSAISPSVIGSFIVGNHLVIMQRWLVRRGGPFEGKTIAQVMSEFGIGVAEHTRPNAIPSVFPAADTLLEPGDGLVIQGPLRTLSDLWNKNVPAAPEVMQVQ